jgi:hypothetical protein
MKMQRVSSFAKSHRRPISLIIGIVTLSISAAAFAAITSGTRTAAASTQVTYTEVAVSKPSVSSGDLMLALVAVNGGSSAVLNSAPSGWTLIASTTNDTNVTLLSYWKVAGGSEPTTYTWQFLGQTTAEGAIIPYAGVDTSDPIDAAAGNIGFGTSATTTSITTSASNEEVLALFAADVGKASNAGAYFSTPTGMTEKSDDTNTPFGPTIAADEVLQVSAGSSGSNASTISGNKPRNWAAQQIALRRAPTAPSVVGSVTNYSSSVATSTHTISATVPSSGSNQCLIVVPIADSGNNGAFTGVTWNGSAMSQIVSVAGSHTGGGMMYYLASPAQGTHDVVLSSANGSIQVIAAVFTLQNCAQSSPVDATSGDLASGASTSQSGSVTTTASNDLVLSWIALGHIATALTDDGGQDSIANFKGTGYDLPFAVSSVLKATTGSQNMGYSWTTSDQNDMFITSIKAAP